MPEILYLDDSEASKNVESLLEGISTIKKFVIKDPATFGLVLPILLTKFGTFQGERIADYKKIVQLKKIPT